MVNLESLSQPSVFQLARVGDFQAIAYWLNTYLVPQDIYARVAVDRPGWLLVLVEFCQSPNRNRLNRFVCHRLCRLNSEVIQGVRIIARPLGSPNIWWDQSIRLAVEPKRSAHRVRSPHGSPRTTQSRPSTPPSLFSRSLRSRRRSPAALTLTTRPTISPAMVESIQTLTESARSLTASLVESARHLSPAQVTTLGKAAAAVFLLSFGVEIAGRNLSLWGDSSGRPKAVQTASGKVSVIQANTVANADDPTVTLTFSSDPAVNLTSIGSMSQVMPAADFGGEITGWPDSEIIDGTLATESPDLGSLNGFEHKTENATVNAIANLAAGSPSTVASEAIAHSSDVLMTNLDRPVNDAQFLLGENPGVDLDKNLDSATTGLGRSPSSSSVTVVNLSGEPLMQDGSTGLVKTLDALEKAGMYAVGAGRNRHEARRPEIIDVRGKRIAYLGYADSDAHAANRWQAGTNPALKDQVAEDIRAIRDQVDWVVVNYHWSQDLASFPAEWQMTIAHHAIDQGADLVVGYHPNVLQGAEIYKGRAIAYSLGDFVFQADGQTVNASAVTASGNASSNNKPTAALVKAQSDTAMLKVSIKDDQMKLEFLPVQIQDAQPAIAQGQKQTEILRYLGQASALFETPLRSPAILNRLPHTSAPNAAPSKAPAAAPIGTPSPSLDESSPALDNRLSPENAPDSFIDYPKSPVTAPAASPTPPNVSNVKPSSDAFVEPQAALPTSTHGSATKRSAVNPLDSQGTLRPALVDFPPDSAAHSVTRSKVAPIPALSDSAANATVENMARLAGEAVSGHSVSVGETAVENTGTSE